jgi:hypothetical protein
MAISLNTISPLSYNEWLAQQDTLTSSLAKVKYNEYLTSWFEEQYLKKENNKESLKKDYIQLVKDLSFLFGQNEKDQFLADIDYTNEEELIFAIPFFAKKLKEISIVLSKKREAVKEAKLRYNLIGSNNGLEKLLNEYILRGFTNTENSITQVPASPLIDFFPDLSAVKDNFFIEIEELHDPNTYFDSDPEVSITEYTNIDDLLNQIPFEGMTEKELTALISTRLLPKVSPTPLSKIFNEYLNSQNIGIVSTSSLSSLSSLINNQIMASEKYMGEAVYGLTALRLKDVYLPDEILNIDFPQGNSWFLWPSGEKIIDGLEFNNIFQSISINQSNLLASGAIAGKTLEDSDLLFTDKNGTVEGAWLNSTTDEKVKDTLRLTIGKSSYQEFIYPFVGFKISARGNDFIGYDITDTFNETFNRLSREKKKEIKEKYYTSVLPNTSVNSMYLNQTKLVEQGAYSSKFSDEADLITKKQKTEALKNIYSDIEDGVLEEAFLYKFINTDLPIKAGTNDIHWPVHVFDGTQGFNQAITIKDDTCVPLNLRDVDVTKTMLGAVAGLDFNNSDVIYKISNLDGEPIEAAWLGTQSVPNLDILTNAIPIYATSAVKCAQYIDGPVQLGLSTVIKPNQKISFIWGDEDTPIDNVLKFVQHSETCPYGKEEHDYYQDQDYRSINPLNIKNYWKDCNCKSVFYSPIGHNGNNFTDYNAMCDYIFADPDGVGSDFAINTWTDTRNLDYRKSPQFAFYKLNKDSKDQPVGWGSGNWKTGTDIPFILKRGRRYTYSRSSFRKSFYDVDQSPSFVAKYAYKNILGIVDVNSPLSLVIAIDISKSQTLDLEAVKAATTRLINKLFEKGENQVQISILTFGTFSSLVSYFSQDKNVLDLYTRNINIPLDPDNYKTNIFNALNLIDVIFNTNTLEGENNVFSFRDICSNLNFVVANSFDKSTQLNTPFLNASKKVLFFTNGVENMPSGLSLNVVEKLKSQGVKFYVADVGAKDLNETLNPEIASNFSSYYDYQKYLISGDGNAESFGDYLAYRLSDQSPIRPSWNKAIRGLDGNWVGTTESSDMSLYPGDYLIYIHRDTIPYFSNVTQSSFSQPSLTFTINVKLDGWDYENSYFSMSAIGPRYGAKPFWGNVYTTPQDFNDTNFKKETMSMGGNIRYLDGYVPLFQPDVSEMVLRTGDFLRYKRIQDKDLNWEQPLNFVVSLSSYFWKKIKFLKDISNLKDFIVGDKIQFFAEPSNEPSDIILESYSSFNPAYYNYYAREGFTYTQDLFYRKRCGDTFTVFNTAVELSPSDPYANILNTHFPTIATISYPSKSVTEKQTGKYLLPDRLGVSTYRGKGYTIEIDTESLSRIDSLSAERMFYDLNKFGPRNRGLTKKDQITPTKISFINNAWVYEPYGRGERSGVIFNPKTNQKFTPYQTSYEIENENKYGISRQSDKFQFWKIKINEDGTKSLTWDDKDFPLNYRGELLIDFYEKKKEKLLVNKGELVQWRTDIFGFDYGLFKQITPNTIEDLDFWVKADSGTLSAINPNINTSNGGSVISWLDQSENNRHLNSFNSGVLSISSSFISFTNAPVLSSNYLNGYPVVYFDGTAALHVNYDLINQNELSVFVVGQFLDNNTPFALNNSQPLFSISVSSQPTIYEGQYFTNETFVIYQENGKNAFGVGNPYTDSLTPSLSGQSLKFNYSIDKIDSIQNSNNKFKLFEFVFTPEYSISYINKSKYLDTNDIGKTLNKPLYAVESLDRSNGIWLGSYGGGQYLTKCAIAEIIIYKRKLTNRERTNIENYLFDKYNLEFD